MKGVRVSTVDNFQGEENEIILLSLVRSNTDNKIGFLKMNNRICVALSRAKVSNVWRNDGRFILKIYLLRHTVVRQSRNVLLFFIDVQFVCDCCLKLFEPGKRIKMKCFLFIIKDIFMPLMYNFVMA